MKLIDKRIYWIGQLSWWIFTTFVLRQPTSKYFEIGYNLPIYLTVSFLIGLLLTHLYKELYQWKFSTQKRVIPVALGGILIVGAAFYLQDYFFGFQRYRKPSMGLPLEPYDYFQFYIESIRYVIIWFLFFHLIVMDRVSHHKAIQLAKAETLLKIAELENLKNQLNPHFLFNAINSIKALTLTDPALARHALTELSDLLRTSLSMGSHQLVSFEDELKLVKDYLFLEKLRYEDRLRYQFMIERATMGCKVPPMSLQLLVENAIKHGVGKVKNGGDIMIQARMNEKKMIIRVTNVGKLNLENHRVGVGMKNLERRLSINFQDKAEFQLLQEGEKVVSQVIIQY
ncbi:sensor histidine kinase [Flectobacillus major]|jgi:sensor histidine kinase YesM|uniref:sensor histidine kinase n=1 Tax=Flectobacillus major TaxID=103 RepID=UPI0006942CF8|nr:histidine kinase [Flectobacillus major]